jgi:hypothetical protein
MAGCRRRLPRMMRDRPVLPSVHTSTNAGLGKCADFPVVIAYAYSLKRSVELCIACLGYEFTNRQAQPVDGCGWARGPCLLPLAWQHVRGYMQSGRSDSSSRKVRQLGDLWLYYCRIAMNRGSGSVGSACHLRERAFFQEQYGQCCFTLYVFYVAQAWNANSLHVLWQVCDGQMGRQP